MAEQIYTIRTRSSGKGGTWASLETNTRSKGSIKVRKSTKILDPSKLFTKNNAYVFVSTIFFIGCTAFVVYRGYRCFDKYLKNPKNSEVSYESSKNHPFPSFTLCASPKQSYNGNQMMTECQLEKHEYLQGAKWVGTNCTDPKILHNQVAATYEDLDIKSIQIYTYALSDNYYWILPGKLEWKLALTFQFRKCFTFSIPDNIVREGIEKVGVVSNGVVSKAFDTLYLHKEGTLSAPIPGGSLLQLKYEEIFVASVTHESIELLNYDGKSCNNDGEYNYDKCKQDYLYKVLYLMKKDAIGESK